MLSPSANCNVSRTRSEKYPDASMDARHYGWKVRLWGRGGGSLLDPLGDLFKDRPFIDIRLHGYCAATVNARLTKARALLRRRLGSS